MPGTETPTHTETHKAHAIARLEERYGFALTEAEYDELCERIRAQRKGGRGRKDLVKFVRMHSRVRSLWRLRHARHWLEAVYDERSGTIVTFLPPGTIKGMG